MDAGKEQDNVKHQFTTREGLYKQLPVSEYFYPKRIAYVPQVAASSSTPVMASFVKIKTDNEEDDYVCFTIGKELFYFPFKSFKQSRPFEYADKRTYKGVAPTCHDINKYTASCQSVRVAVGFLAGQIQIIDVQTKESLLILNEDRFIEKSRVTCVKWYPDSENHLLAAHISGFMYTYDVCQPCAAAAPQYHVQALKSGDGYSIFTVKAKSSSSNANGAATSCNPIYKWVMSSDGSGINFFVFSPCKRFVAIVTQSGFLKIIDHQTFELYGSMKSYFGGLLSCCWSPDGRFVVTGGEDDLITVWSFCQQCVVARGNGHKSWVSNVSFDPLCCKIPSDADMKSFYGLPCVNDRFEINDSCNTSLDATADDSEAVSASKASGDATHSKALHINKYKKYAYNRETSTTSGLQLQCNGDALLPVPSSAIKRLRTYSNVSKLSRLSIAMDSGAPPLCYRFGSVGQDAQLCLWEIDEHVLCFSQRKKSIIASKCDCPASDTSTQSSLEHASATNSTTSDIPFNGSLSSEQTTSGNGNQYYMPNHTPVKSTKSSFLASQSRSNSVPYSINVSTQLNAGKHQKTSAKSGSSSSSLSAIRKFATMGSHDNPQKLSKEHKRNLSLPHFGFKTGQNHNSNSTSKSGFLKKQHPPKVVPTFGTCLCPHLEDTAMLEPLICKKIAEDRITGLAFLEEYLVTTVQDGYVHLWLRPSVMREVNSPQSSPPLKDQTRTKVFR